MDLFSCLSPFVFCSFASGSSGNCFFVGVEDEGFLIDAGVSLAHLKKSLQQIDYQQKSIKCIFLTHDHIDHVKGLDVIAEALQVPIYAHADCIAGVLRGKATRNMNPDIFHAIEPFDSIEMCGIHIEPFPVMHDGRGTMGYYFRYDDKNLTLATDVGMIDSCVESYLDKSESIVLESNYDENMLWKGPYSYILKKRIAGPTGHLSNVEASRYIAKRYLKGLKNVMLCHLSENNNTPELAMQNVYQILQQQRIRTNPDVTVFPLPRHQSTGLIHL